MFALAGVPVSVGFGLIADCLPPWATIALWDVSALAFFATTIVPQVAAQHASIVLLTVLSNLFFLATPVFVMMYTPLELFGTLYGALQLFVGTLQIGFIVLEEKLAVSFAPGDDAEPLRVQGKLVAWTTLIALAAVGNQIAWRRRAPPTLGSVTTAVVRRKQGAMDAKQSLQAA